MIILGFDPGLATVGYGVIEKQGNRIIPLEYGTITTAPTTAFPVRLREVREKSAELIARVRPDAVVLEELFFNTNITTGINVAQARGALLTAVSDYTDRIYEFTPLQIKQALVGYGRADKQQVQKMVKTILGLDKIPRPDDAADGLAVAICLANTSSAAAERFRIG